ncbi:unnamed protein product [Paramecium pentaurelia]|uniref:Uncharacterized protein n=1 Tax=Paramecium pentaurelia TaxID=43138 RepID=A0A8S1XM86_9CILI|nr:unnamed protein product [Paramecium pentaurelia]
MYESINLSTQDFHKLQTNLKSIWLPKKEKEAEIIVYNLINIKLEVQSLMREITEKVNETLIVIDDMIQLTQSEMYSIKKNIKEIQIKELKSLNELKQSINIILCQQITRQVQQLNNLQTIWRINILEKLERKLKQIKEGDSKCGFDQYFNLSLKQENNNIWICNKHFEQIYYVNLQENVNTQNRLACKKCIQSNQEFKKLEELQLLWEQNVQLTLGKFNHHQNILIIYWNKILEQVQRFNKIIYTSSNLKNDILQQQYQLMLKDWLSLSKEELNDIACNLNQQYNQLIFSSIEKESLIKENQLLKLINQFKLFLDHLDLSKEINKIDSNKNIIINQYCQQKIQQIQSIEPVKFKFELINRIKQDRCFSFAFFIDSSVMVVGQNSMIKVFEFKDGNLKETQQLTEHKDYVRCLYFMKKTLQFVSGCNDNLIMIWSWDDKRHWYCEQKLEGHTDYIRGGLIMNNKEDLIISGSDDSTIRFWTKKNNNQWILYQTLNGHTKEVKSISLNDSQNQLISCSFSNEVLVTEFKNNEKLWITIQKIQVDRNGYSLCYISDTLFTFQPHELEIMCIYEFDYNKEQFIKTKQVKIKSGDNRCDFFPQQFNKEKQILLHKNGRTINIIKTIDSREFIPVQYIENSDNYLYGALTNDAQYLVTWDNQEKEIKIRKYKE